MKLEFKLNVYLEDDYWKDNFIQKEEILKKTIQDSLDDIACDLCDSAREEFDYDDASEPIYFIVEDE